MSILNGGSPILADVDPSNAAFSRYFADVARPDTETPAGVVTSLQDLIEHCIIEQQSAIIDLGGGDTTLRTLATEMPGLAEHIEASGLSPVVFHLIGIQPEDLEPTTTLTMRKKPRLQHRVCEITRQRPCQPRDLRALQTVLNRTAGHPEHPRDLSRANPFTGQS